MAEGISAEIEQEEAAHRPTGVVRIEDYQPPSWRIDQVYLDFALAAEKSEVMALLCCQRQEGGAPLVLDCDGSAVQLNAFALWDEAQVAVADFRLEPHPGVTPLVCWPEGEKTVAHFRLLENGEPTVQVTVTDRQVVVSGPLPERVWVAAAVELVPAANTALSGLYESASGLFTQCEPEGFRRIVPFIDRPDVLARYRVRLVAERSRYPVLLSNGNLVAHGDLPGGRHFAVWDDPFPKPCYLFALVAADLAATEEEITLADGRRALLQVWTAHQHQERAGWALTCLAAAVRWDERRFGRLLDLSRYMIVAVDDFNMGAMENKGLNLFNAKYVLVTPERATDADYANVESIVGHEYFHNWTGNRVTCRDWFQLTLKEGLTVFRDQEFSADQLAAAAESPEAAAAARAVKRIDDVATLLAVQFPEDDGPMRHPIRPRSYRAIDNFYTATVYEKGAEVVRLLHTLLGEEGFCKGLDHYFARFDGQAVTCEDFVAAMAEANGVDLTQFLRWYDAAGTPELIVSWRWLDEGGQEAVELTLQQRLDGWDCAAKPLLIPVRLGWVGKSGETLSFRVTPGDERDDESHGDEEPGALMVPLAPGGRSLGNGPEVTEAVVVLDRPVRRWLFRGLEQSAEPVPSLLRGFSAPVRLRWAATPDGQEPLEALVQRFAGDADPFNRWQAGQALMIRALCTAAWERNAHWFAQWLDLWRTALADSRIDPGYRTRLLLPPAEAVVRDAWPRPVDPVLVRARLMAFWRVLAGAASLDTLMALLERAMVSGPYRYTPQAAGWRSLAGLVLKWLALRDDRAEFAEMLATRWAEASSLTERLMVVDAALCSPKGEVAESYLAAFARQYEEDPLVLDKWLHRHATRWAWQGQGAEALVDRVAALTHHPHFRWSNPNRVYALLLGFFGHNAAMVAAAGAPAWQLWQEAVVRLDGTNPLVAARLARVLEQVPQWMEPYRSQAMAAVRAVAAAARSAEVQEVVERIVASCSRHDQSSLPEKATL